MVMLFFLLIQMNLIMLVMLLWELRKLGIPFKQVLLCLLVLMILGLLLLLLLLVVMPLRPML